MGYKEENETSVVGSTPVFSTPPAKTTPTPPASNAPVMSAAPSESAPKPTPVSSVPLSSPTQSAPQVTTAPSQVPLAAPTNPVAPSQPTPTTIPNFSSSRPNFSDQETISEQQKRLAEEARYAEELKSASDIILQKDKKPINKKLIALLTGAAALIIGAVVLIAVVLPNLPKKNAEKNNSASSITAPKGVNDARNTLLNFCLFNAASDSSITGKYDENADYTILTAFEEHDVSFFDNAKSYLDQFLDVYGNFVDEKYNTETNNGENDSFDKEEYENEIVNDFKNNFNFIYDYIKSNLPSENDIFNTFKDRGADATYAFVENSFNNLLKTNIEEGKKYAEAQRTVSLAAVDNLVIYDTNGCIVDGVIADQCNVPDSVYDKYPRLSEAEIILATNILDYPTYTVEYLVELAFALGEEEL